MNDYMPALIGLIGVIVGGTISVIAQRRRDVEEQVRYIRKDCSVLATAATNYSATMAQFVREVNEDKEKARQAPPGSDLSDIDRGDEYWNRLGTELYDAFNETFATSLQLTATKDRRVGHQATVLRLTTISAQNEISPVLENKGEVANERAEELREDINHEAELLLGMVAPRTTESFIRFRSRKTAARVEEQDRKKKEAKEDGEQ